MKEITITFYNSVIESVENVPKGQSIITRDIDENGKEPEIIRRWYPDGISERSTEKEAAYGQKKDEIVFTEFLYLDPDRRNNAAT